jgi:hypothetical protein
MTPIQTVVQFKSFTMKKAKHGELGLVVTLYQALVLEKVGRLPVTSLIFIIRMMEASNKVMALAMMIGGSVTNTPYASQSATPVTKIEYIASEMDWVSRVLNMCST